MFMQLMIGQESHLVVFELFTGLTPKTCNNFISLCEGFKGSATGKNISYVGSKVHRVVKGMYIQLGKIDTEAGDNASIYPEGEFADESFHVKHTQVGLLGMCKRSGLKHTNESQFYITTGAPLSFLDNQNVVFGRVITGMRAIKMIERIPLMNEKPTERVEISKAGRHALPGRTLSNKQ